MGRYAFFSTGLEYKFAFASQESEDIRLFGGVVATGKYDLLYGKYRHEWNQKKDSETILQTLKSYTLDTELPFPDFTSFEASLEGTYKLKGWFYDHRHKFYEWLSGDANTFELGCLIYHQLSYTPNLSAGYEP